MTSNSQNKGSLKIDRLTRLRASRNVSEAIREGSISNQIDANAENQRTQCGKRKSGATANKARCAASPYFVISFCT